MKRVQSEIYTPEAIEKNAVVFLRKLLRPGAVIRPFPEMQKRSEEMGIYNQNDLRPKAKSAIPISLIKIFHSRGWLEKNNDEYRLSSCGAAWLKRKKSRSESFKDQHQDCSSRKVQETGRIVQVNDLESPLAWLRKRKDSEGRPLLDDAQYEAGEKLRRDFTLAQMTPTVTASWSATAGGSKRRKQGDNAPSSNMTDKVIDARRRVSKAMDAVGPELASVLLDVCCLFRGLGQTENLKGWPQRSGKVVLQIALSALARHYGFIGEAGHESAHIITWSTEDNRPDL